MTTHTKPVLTYFSGRGLAEPARLIFAEAGVEYVDNRVTDTTELKTTGKLPFGQVPLLEMPDGFTLAQSMSIARFLARTHGLYGKDEKEGATADMIVDGFVDVMMAARNAKTDEEKAKFKSETLPRWLGYFATLLKNSKSTTGLFVGDNVTYADLIGLNALDNLKTAWEGSLDTFPTLTAFRDRVAERPRIAKWLKERPVTPW